MGGTIDQDRESIFWDITPLYDNTGWYPNIPVSKSSKTLDATPKKKEYILPHRISFHTEDLHREQQHSILQQSYPILQLDEAADERGGSAMWRHRVE